MYLCVLAHMCLCVRACVQMTLQPAVLTQRQCVSMQLGPRTHGRSQEQKVLRREITCMCLCPKSCFMYMQEVTEYKQVHAGESVVLCVHFILASAFVFLAAGPKESKSGVNFKL